MTWKTAIAENVGRELRAKLMRNSSNRTLLWSIPLVNYHLNKQHNIISYRINNIMSYHIISFPIILYDILSLHYMTLYDITSYQIIYIISYHIALYNYYIIIILQPFTWPYCWAYISSFGRFPCNTLLLPKLLVHLFSWRFRQESVWGWLSGKAFAHWS